MAIEEVCYIMGFLNFLKRNKSDTNFKFPTKEELDIPAAPDFKHEANQEAPVFPSFDEDEAPITSEDLHEEEPSFEEEDMELPIDRETGKKPLFVKSSYFKAAIDDLTMAKNTLNEADKIVNRIQDFDSDQDKEFEKWKGQIFEIQRKLVYADKMLFDR